MFSPGQLWQVKISWCMTEGEELKIKHRFQHGDVVMIVFAEPYINVEGYERWHLRFLHKDTMVGHRHVCDWEWDEQFEEITND